MEEKSQIIMSVFIADTITWKNVTVNYTTKGNEQYFMLGYFKKNYAGDTLYNINGFINGEYYADIYIDSLSLYEGSRGG